MNYDVVCDKFVWLAAQEQFYGFPSPQKSSSREAIKVISVPPITGNSRFDQNYDKLYEAGTSTDFD